MSDISYEKVDDNTIRKTETESVVSDLSLDFLIDRKAKYESDKADAISYFEKCIADLDDAINNARSLSIMTTSEINVAQGAKLNQGQAEQNNP